MIQLHDLQFTPFISEEKIMAAIDEVAQKLNRELKYENPVFLGILNGAFLFASELIKRFEGDCEVSFVRLSSYEGTDSSGSVKTFAGLNRSLENRT
ncbi:MAG TPA: phosphoribosyltransferase family protein, partial [Salinimicrobium sp.]|nr:phosphoribosyltransferase family protein [Salinimicrobium sp.]